MYYLMSESHLLTLEKVSLQNGKVFVGGIETNNAELIGYAVLDIAENIGQNEKLIL